VGIHGTTGIQEGLMSRSLRSFVEGSMRREALKRRLRENGLSRLGAIDALKNHGKDIGFSEAEIRSMLSAVKMVQR